MFGLTEAKGWIFNMGGATVPGIIRACKANEGDIERDTKKCC